MSVRSDRRFHALVIDLDFMVTELTIFVPQVSQDFQESDGCVSCVIVLECAKEDRWNE